MDLKKNDEKQPLQQIKLGNKYLLKERLGGGSFGQIFRAVNLDNEANVAAKLEKRSPNATLVREAKVISDMRGQTGFPSLYDYGKEDSYNFIIVSLLGWNLEKLFKACHHRFSLKTVLMIADQILTRIEVLHSKNYIHRDIKPENFCIGKGSLSRTTFMIDFGLAKNFKDVTGKHISFRENKGLIGTARYASLNAHLGREISRRDDLESIGYMLIYFLTGKLPWQDLQGHDKNQKYQKIAELKMKIPTSQLCQGLPPQFETYLNYVKNLDFMEDPDYKYLKKQFRILFVENGYDFDYHYDWLDTERTRNSVDTFMTPNPHSHQKDIRAALPDLKAHKKESSQLAQAKAAGDLHAKKKDSSTRDIPVNDDKNPKIALIPTKTLEKSLDENLLQEDDDKVAPLALPEKHTVMTLSRISPTASPSGKRKTLVPDSLAKNMSSSSMFSSKNMNVGLNGPVMEEEEIPSEISIDEIISVDKFERVKEFVSKKRNTVFKACGETFVSADNLELPAAGTKAYNRGKTKTFAHPYTSRHEKKSNFAKESPREPITPMRDLVVSRKETTDEGKKLYCERSINFKFIGNLNDSSINERKETSYIGQFLPKKNFLV